MNGTNWPCFYPQKHFSAFASDSRDERKQVTEMLQSSQTRLKPGTWQFMVVILTTEVQVWCLWFARESANLWGNTVEPQCITTGQQYSTHVTRTLSLGKRTVVKSSITKPHSCVTCCLRAEIKMSR